MKKNNILIIVLTLVLGITGFALFKWWQNSSNTNIWEIVPGSTVLAIETSDVAGNWNDLQNRSVWKNFSSIPGFFEIQYKINSIDSLSGKNGAFAKFLNEKQVVISVHSISNDDFGFVFYMPLNSSQDQKFLKKFLSAFESDKSYLTKERNFQGFNIKEIKSKVHNKSFSFLIYNNIFVGSYNALLIEDVIRTINDSGHENFLKRNQEIFNLSKVGLKSAKIYIDYTYFHKFLALFADDEASRFLRPLGNFGSSAALDINLSHQDILVNGFSVASDPNHFLNCFKGQKSQPFNVKSLVSNRTAIFYHYGFDNAKTLRESLKSFWDKNGLPLSKQWKEIETNYHVNINSFYDWIGNEIGLGIMESMDPKNPDRLIYVHTKNNDDAKASLNDLVRQISSVLNDTIYKETYSNIEIKQINIPQFPSLLLGKMFSGFDQCFFANINNYMVFSNSIQGLKSLIMDVEKEETWGKSIKQNIFLEQCLNESNISIFINAPRIWNILQTNTSLKWQPFFNKYSPQFKLFENVATQFTYIDNKFYTSVILKHEKLIDKATSPSERFELVENSTLESPAIIRPFVVKNHIDKSNEVFVQDSLQQIYLISKTGQILWKKPIESKIVSDVVQIDYYKNGKLQLCFATQNKLHIVDRNGVELSKFPIDIPNGAEGYNLSVIDYDNSKEYRFLISDKKGNIYMFDKNGSNLEGWQPHAMTYQLAGPIRHIRVKGRDYIIAIQENGIIHVLSRIGNISPGFPLDLKAPIRKPVFIEHGPTLELTKFTTITETGVKVQFNLAGEILKEDQWLKPSKDSKFQLIADVFARNWVIARQGNDKINILDAEGNTIFEQEAPTNTSLSVQFYNFGGGNEIYAVTDHEQEFTYLYNKEGLLINSIPLESGYQIGLTYSEAAEKYRVFKVFDKMVSIVSFTKSQ